MRIKIRLFAVLRERAGCDSLVVEAPEGATIEQLKALASDACPALGDLQSVAGVVGTTYARPDTVVRESDEVAFLPPVSGGMASADELLARGVFELDAHPLDITALQGRVGHPSCGAIVVFTGTTRETNRGQDVTRLDYEAFEEMAGPEMERIFSDCLRAVAPDHDGTDIQSSTGQAVQGLATQELATQGLATQGLAASEGATDRSLRMLCVHRTGTVGVGEASVVVAVASPHREAAFVAARFLIDTLKERLPVWKKEVYRGGHHWIGDRS